jgi:AcrR family transcriptional regulator
MSSDTTVRAPRRREPLTRERIVRTAIALADDIGIETLSMRKLARELDVEAMSLYNHVKNKGDLVDAMVDDVVSEIELPTDPDWEAAVRRCAISAYDAFLRHPWACGLVMAPSGLRLEDNPRLRYMEWLLGRLAEAGFSPELTYRGYHALDSHILGFTMWQLGHSIAGDDILGGLSPEEFIAQLVPVLRGAGYSHLAEHAEQHVSAPWRENLREFEFGLDLILDGLKKALP